MKRFVLTFILPVLACADNAIDLGSRRELFVDRFLIDQLKGVELRMHEPIREGVAVKFDKPFKFSGNKLELNFETSAAGYLRVEIQDENGIPLAESREMIGDDIARNITGSGGNNVS